MKTFLLLLLSASVLAAQPSRDCTLGLSESPSIRGLKLGMTDTAAAAAIGIPFEASPNNSAIRLAGSLRFRRPGFENINSLFLHSFDGLVYKIDVEYDVHWPTTKDFVDNFAPKLGLPLTGWDLSSARARMTCREFEITLSAIVGSSIELTDTTAVQKMDDIKRQAEEAKKKALKP